MESLFAVALMAGFVVAIKVLRLPLSWPGRVPEGVARQRPHSGERAKPGGADEMPADEMTVEWGLLAEPFIRRRLDALVEELERLDRSTDTFAKAFHTTVARSAYEALLADASRLAGQPRHAGALCDFQLTEPSAGSREELEL
jgi:hypothetical protein